MIYEPMLRANLTKLCATYGEYSGLASGTVARRFCKDDGFLRRVNDDGRTFTVRQYDTIACRFAKEWPKDLAWPAAVPRPDRKAIKKVMDQPIQRKQDNG